MITKFVKEYLSNVEWNKKNEDWQISGIVHGMSNKHLKFDIRNLRNNKNNEKEKFVKYKNSSNKILFETQKDWILIDTKEFVKYMKKNQINTIKLEDLLNSFKLTIILPKKYE